MLGVRQLVLCLLLLVCCDCRLHRPRRYLVYPEGSEIELAMGFDLPIEVKGGEVGLGMELEVVYEVPSNASELTAGYVSYARRLPSRWQLYSLLEGLLHRVGVDGRACLLRAVCEAASSHMVRGLGLSAEILHILLTVDEWCWCEYEPSSTDEVEGTGQQVRREYSSAETMGTQLQANCAILYPECSLSLLGLVSRN